MKGSMRLRNRYRPLADNKPTPLDPLDQGPRYPSSAPPPNPFLGDELRSAAKVEQRRGPSECCGAGARSGERIVVGFWLRRSLFRAGERQQRYEDETHYLLL